MDAHLPQQEHQLTGKSALVVGGSWGIGAAVCRRLAPTGVSLYIHGGHDRGRLQDTVDECTGQRAQVNGVLQEINSANDVPALLEQTGEVDILVVSMGPYLEKRLDQTTASEWQRMVDLNLTVPGVLVSRLLPAMTRNGWGRIVFLGGPRSDRATGYLKIAAYGSAKHGLASLTRSVARQFAKDGVRCNMICPGYVDTPGQTESNRKTGIRKSPGRLIHPAEIADLAVEILILGNDSINGAVIPVDFGL